MEFDWNRFSFRYDPNNDKWTKVKFDIKRLFFYFVFNQLQKYIFNLKMQPMNIPRIGACLCYITSVNQNKMNKRRAATPAEISRKSLNLNDSVSDQIDAEAEAKRED